MDGEAEGTSGVCGSRKGKEVRRDRGKKCKPGSVESRINGEGRRVEELERAGTIWKGWGKEERETVRAGASGWRGNFSLWRWRATSLVRGRRGGRRKPG